MLKATTLFAVLTSCVVMGTMSVSVEAERKAAASEPGFVIGNRDQPLDSQLVMIAKHFCVALRRNHANAGAEAFREFFDPRFLEKHGLTGERFRMQTMPVVSVYAMKLSRDRQSILCLVDTKEGEKEVILLRVSLREGRLYLSPHGGPDEQSGLFTPWMLRSKV